MQDILQKVCALAVEVGEYQVQQRRHFSADMVRSKRSHDYVSEVDRASERMIVEALRRILPSAGFITEEKTTEQQSFGEGLTWVVDPLDGTTNYIHDLSPWCVCIALCRGSETLLGVVYEPVRRELFYALTGHGAWLRRDGGEPLRLSASPTADIDQALVMVGYPYDAEAYRDFCMDMSAALYGHCASIRSMGSAEAELCYVAAGRLDVYFEGFLQPWDVRAGALIVQQAGGIVSDFEGTDLKWQNGRQLLAAAPALHRQVLDILAEHLIALG